VNSPTTLPSAKLVVNQFTKIGITTSKREGSFLSKESQRSINNDFMIMIENFESRETVVGFSFIKMFSATMLATDVALPGVRPIS
jgi:hypothetical protein